MEKENIRIVVADDHPIFRDGLCRLLALEEDFEVVAQAQDGRQVLDVLQQHEPDILLLDLKMPGLDGLATLQRLQIAKNKTRVIVLTASDDKNEFVQAMKLGTSGIVLKQTATELLIKSIRKVHAGEIWLDSHTTAAVIRQFVANDEAPAMQSLPPAPPTRERERSPLSQREREIVALVAQGFKNKEMAEKMFISEQTVKNHLHNIFDKLGVSDRDELALYTRTTSTVVHSRCCRVAYSRSAQRFGLGCFRRKRQHRKFADLEKNVMDVSKILAELKAEREQIEEAILSLERLAQGRGRVPGRPPNWMADVVPPKRRGRPSGSNDPGSQPPPAAPAAARIAGRLDRAVSGRKRPQGVLSISIGGDGTQRGGPS